MWKPKVWGHGLIWRQEFLGTSTDGHGKRFVTSDIYAFGVIAYRFLTGRFPRRTFAEAINMTPFPRPTELNSSVMVELDALVMRCLEKRPDNRYSTGATLLAAVEELQDHLATKRKDTLELPPSLERGGPSAGEELARMAKEMLEAGESEAVIKWLDEAMQRISTSPAVLVIYAEAAKQAKRWDTARLVYERIFRWMKSCDLGEEELRGPAEGLAEVEVRLKRYEDASEHFQWLVSKWPDNRWYRYRLAISLGLAGRYRKSIELLKALNDPLHPSALICAKIALA